MCFHYRQTKNGLQLEKQFQLPLKKGVNIQPITYVNGFAHPEVPIITNQESLITTGQWGLLPDFATNISFAKNTLNARAETISEKPSFAPYIHQRCLVLSDGFYEWQWHNVSGIKKQKYFITTAQQSMVMAGIWSCWKDQITFSIVTTQANDLMSEIHNTKKRMPVVLKPTDFNDWLQGAPIHNFQFPYEVPLIAEKIVEENQNFSLF
ncbi:MAG: SOS response-associated peptidase [Flavobacteriales bacterium]|nr:SOS response-associated peptidase [Flavobacteriales bacterium]